MIDCNWDAPGQSPYTGTYQEWVQRLPAAEQRQLSVLSTKVAKREFDAVVYARRDAITDANGRLGYTYSPNITYMAFGKGGAICANVRLDKWKPEHVESAMLFCAGSICAARWSICNNWSIVYREQMRAEKEDYDAPVILGPPSTASVPVDEGGYALVSVAPQPDEYVPVGGMPPSSFTFIGGGGGFAPCLDCVPYCPPVSPIPEPETWLSMLAGLGLVMFYRRRGRLPGKTQRSTHG